MTDPTLRVEKSFPVPVADVRYVAELYPRAREDDAAIERYRAGIENLPPIIVARGHVLVDGFHRWQAHRREGKLTIAAIDLGNLADAEIFEQAIRRNATHGYQLSEADKKQVAKRLWPGATVERIAELLSVSQLTVTNKYIADELAEQTRTRNRAILALHEPVMFGKPEDGGQTQETLAELVTGKTGIPCSHQTVGRVLAALSPYGSRSELSRTGHAVQHVVNNHFGAVKPADDGGVDGLTADGTAIQTTIAGPVDRKRIDAFAAGMRRHESVRGVLVAREFNRNVDAELDRLRRVEGLDIQTAALDEIIEPVAAAVFKLTSQVNLNTWLECQAELPELLPERDHAAFWDEMAWRFGKPPDSREDFDVWDFSKCGEGGTASFFGRTPPQIVENLLWLYTEPGQIVFDPFAGGGTTIDVAKRMGRRVWASDLNPSTPILPIHAHDITSGWPKDAPPRVDFILLEPPYWKQAAGRYSRDAEDLGNLSEADFNAAWLAIARTCFPRLTEGGTLAFSISPSVDGERVVDHAFQMYVACLETGFKMHRRIIAPYQTQQATGQQVNWAREKRQLLKRYRDIVVFKA